MENGCSGHSHLGPTWRQLSLIVVLGCLPLACGKKADTSSPGGTVAKFNDAMGAGKYSEAAECFAFATQGARDSTDWSTYSESQRKLIVGKLREERAGVLESAAQSWTAQNYQIGAANESGDAATVELKAASGFTVTVQLVREEGGWRILQLPGR